MAPQVYVGRESIDDIKAGLIDDKLFGSIAHCLANQSPCPLPSTTSTNKPKLWVPAQRFNLEENGLRWVHGDLEWKQVNQNAWANEKDKDDWVCNGRDRM